MHDCMCVYISPSSHLLPFQFLSVNHPQFTHPQRPSIVKLTTNLLVHIHHILTIYVYTCRHLQIQLNNNQPTPNHSQVYKDLIATPMHQQSLHQYIRLLICNQPTNQQLRDVPHNRPTKKLPINLVSSNISAIHPFQYPIPDFHQNEPPMSNKLTHQIYFP